MGGVKLDRFAVAIGVIFALGLLLRVASAVPFTVEHPDEIWQYLEPAYHLTKGPWVQTWEYREGLRSWLPPMLIAAPMGFGQWLGAGALLLPRLLFAALSMIIVASAIIMGARLSKTHALIAGLATAVWFEFVYMAPHMLMESISTAFFMAGAALLYGEKQRDFLAGGLFGLSFVLRFQHAPAIAVLILLVIGPHFRRYGQLLAGAVVPLLTDAVVNGAMGATPFAWIAQNFVRNIIDGKSAQFGVAPVYQYSVIVNHWSLLTPALFGFAFVGAWRFRALALAALMHLAVHSFIPHKEWRFVYVTVVVLVFLAAVGSVDLIQMLKERWHKIGAVIAAGFWIISSAVLYVPTAQYFTANGGIGEALGLAGKIDPTCSIASYDVLAGSHVLTGTTASFYAFIDGPDGGAQLRRYQNSFGSVVTLREFLPEIPDGFENRRCFPGLRDSSKDWCVARRRAICSGIVPERYELNHWLAAHGR